MSYLCVWALEICANFGGVTEVVSILCALGAWFHDWKKKCLRAKSLYNHFSSSLFAFFCTANQMRASYQRIIAAFLLVLFAAVFTTADECARNGQQCNTTTSMCKSADGSYQCSCKDSYHPLRLRGTGCYDSKFWSAYNEPLCCLKLRHEQVTVGAFKPSRDSPGPHSAHLKWECKCAGSPKQCTPVVSRSEWAGSRQNEAIPLQCNHNGVISLYCTPWDQTTRDWSTSWKVVTHKIRESGEEKSPQKTMRSCLCTALVHRLDMISIRYVQL